jgi:hypothetical protein
MKNKNKPSGGRMTLYGRILALLAMSVLLAASAAEAQSTPKVVKATIPFDFTVGGHTLPAGDYSFVTPASNFLQVRDRRGHSLLTAITGSVEAAAPSVAPKLHFRIEGGQHFLVRIWQEGSRNGQELFPSKQDIELAKQQSVPTLSSTRARP